MRSPARDLRCAPDLQSDLRPDYIFSLSNSPDLWYAIRQTEAKGGILRGAEDKQPDAPAAYDNTDARNIRETRSRAAACNTAEAGSIADAHDIAGACNIAGTRCNTVACNFARADCGHKPGKAPEGGAQADQTGD